MAPLPPLRPLLRGATQAEMRADLQRVRREATWNASMSAAVLATFFIFIVVGATIALLT